MITKKDFRIVDAYVKATKNVYINDVYVHKCNRQKQMAEEYILGLMEQMHGYDYTVVSHTNHYFVAGFTYKAGGEDVYYIETYEGRIVCWKTEYDLYKQERGIE